MAEFAVPAGPVTGDPVVFWVTVTPQMARNWLDDKLSNRLLSERHVAAWSRDIAAGNVHQNHQGLAFAWHDGRWRLSDGQHRCAAVCRTGTAVRFLCTFGADPGGVDRVRVRTFADQLKIEGAAQHMQLSAIARLVFSWIAVGEPPTRAAKLTPTDDEMREVLAEHPCIAETLQLADRVRRGCGLRGSVAGWLRFATAHTADRECKSPDDDWFVGKLIAGDGLTSGHPALTLRNRIIADKEFRRDQFRLAAGCVYAWNAYRDGRDLAIIKTPATLTPATFPEVH